jgi:tetratricopeptide (TPR) repeat protein/class 3 adenylate cyclase/tRNA A-37 threonylcarbamoyl transferase component Bud32
MIGAKLGSYEIVQEIGRGGMATVYRAYQPAIDRFVAVKVIRTAIAKDAEAMARFQREARLVARLEHPHLLPVHDFDGAHDPPYIVMRYLEGGTLKDVLHQRQISLKEIGYLLRQIAAALDYAHRRGVVHRDVKPSNIMVDREGNAFVADFGIARMTAQAGMEPGQALTQSGSLIGTPDYVAPEQAMGQETDHRADLYSLGVVMFEVLTGQLPYQAESPMGVVVQHIHEPVPSACAMNPDLPSEVDDVLRRAMAKDPEARYGTASELAEAVIAALGGTVASTPTGLRAAAEETALRIAHQRGAEVSTSAQRTPTERNKLVTVLYVSLVEYAEYAEAEDARDAEAARDALERLWGRLEGIIAGRGGALESRTYDTALAAWGADAAREDDPERAIRAALEMQHVLHGFLKEKRVEDEGEPLPMQVSITTGLALITPGDEATGDFSASGPTISLVHRLERAAPPGSVLISHDTYRHVRGLFEVEEGDLLRIRGRKRRLATYVVHSARPRAFRLATRGVEGVETRMIGRQAELEQLQDAFYAAIEDRETQMATIVGGPGLGKSRLLYEFTNWAGLEGIDFWLMRGRATPETAGHPYALLRDLFSDRFEIRDSDNPATVRAKLEEGIISVVDTSGAHKGVEMAHFIGHLIGFDFADSPHLSGTLVDAQAFRMQALYYLGQFLQHLARGSPVLIELDGVHWADESSLDAIDHLVRRNQALRLLVVCLARPELYERRPAWGSGQSFHARLDLRPLSKRESRRLVGEILQRVDKVPNILRDLVVERAEGNPFYVEEMIKVLTEDRVIVKGEPAWRVEEERLSGMRVPSTLTGLVQVRLDGLFPAERTGLQRAAVVGRIFWDDAVRALGAADGAAVDVAGALGDLVEREFVYLREASAFAGTQEYVFASNVLRDVVLEGTLGRQRHAYHARMAEWLVERSGERVDEYAGVIADHLERAGEGERAVPYLHRAGQRAREQYASDEAIRYLCHALDLVPETDLAQRFRLLYSRESNYHVLGKREAQRQDLAAMEELSKILDDGGRDAVWRRVAVAYHWSRYAWMTSDYPASIAAAQELIDLSQVAPADMELNPRVWGHSRLGLAYWRQGNYEAALLQMEQALSLSRSAEYAWFEANNLGGLGLVHMSRGDYAEAGDFFEQALRVYGEIGARRNEGWMINNLGAVFMGRGEYDTATTYLERSLRISREVDDRPAEGWTLRNLGQLAQHLGNYARARTHYEQSLTIFDEIGDSAYKSETLSNLSLLFHRLADDDLARQYSQRALLVAQEIGFRPGQGYALTYLGHALAGLGQWAEAADAYQQALTLRREMGEHHLATETQSGLVRVALDQGDPTRALAHLKEILDYLEAHPGIEGTAEPFQVYLTCYHALCANDDPRAKEVLAAAYNLLQKRAKIDDQALRRSFLENVATHKKIVREFEQSSKPTSS